MCELTYMRILISSFCQLPCNITSNAENMPTYLQRLKHSLRRRSRPQNTNINIPSSQDDKGKQRANEYDLDEDVPSIRRSASPPPLPEITDSGPPMAGCYENEDIFWNSVMTEADVDPMRANARTGWNAKYQNSWKTITAGPWKNVRSPGPGLEPLREEVCSRTPEVNRARQQQQAKDDSRQWAHDATHGRNRVDNDLTVIFAYPPRYPPVPSKPQSPPREPIRPGTAEWDTFMDFPSKHSVHLYRDSDGNRHVVLPVRAISTAETTTAKLPAVHESFSTPRKEELAFSPAPEPSNIVLNRVLANEYVDPAMRQAVRQRVQDSSTTNGSGHGESLFVSAQEAGLVPNFSYPIPANAFYERHTSSDHQDTSLHGVGVEDEKGDGRKVEKEEILTNGVTPHPCDSDSTSSHHDELNRALTFPFERPDPCDSEDSTESDHEELYCAPTPSGEPIDRVHSLLCNMLTPSELSLHYHILNPSSLSSARPPPFPATTPSSNAASPTPRPARLILKLTTITLGLQDRINGLEDDLVPQLSTWLEQKSNMIDNLSITVLSQKAEITKLKYAIDFGNKILSGCWDRECAVLHTLLDTQANHQKKSNGSFRKLLGRRDREYRSAYRGNPDISLDKQHSVPSSKSTESDAALSKKELDALLAIAAQNVRIMNEDIGDMVKLVQECKQRPTGIQEIVRAKEGSWRKCETPTGNT